MPEFFEQPRATSRLGDYLDRNLRRAEWTTFRAAVAFAKRSGVQYLAGPLGEFAARGDVKVTVGIDHQGTSEEALRDLLAALSDRGELWVLHNRSNSTFHPKVYVFRNDERASLTVGSGNLTRGGLFTNYEASLCLDLDLSSPTDRGLLESVEEGLDAWRDSASGVARLLTTELLGELVDRGLVLPEILSRPDDEARPTSDTAIEPSEDDEPVQEPLFDACSVQPAPPAPRVAEELREPAEPRGGPATAPKDSDLALRGFVMTLQQTDVGVGQVTAGTSRRSPEIFVPLAARDAHTAFWGWPREFEEDVSREGKFDRSTVARLGGQLVDINMMTWPVKHDFRLRSETLRSAGNVGDLIRIELGPDGAEYEYYIEIVPHGSALFEHFHDLCVNRVRNSSRLWGYY